VVATLSPPQALVLSAGSGPLQKEGMRRPLADSAQGVTVGWIGREVKHCVTRGCRLLQLCCDAAVVG